ncbi:hypothetical protein [Kineococcus indalonis]|uniref:hypothetical protein n=1 Tax=Kineococcus indalonis TaxID=2696566 RepID=UPI0014122D8A|nr:hypothetical protein [Kineococcus indalonis]NAZ87109.1 hypothetical protein [Kineococcus indalonis]
MTTFALVHGAGDGRWARHSAGGFVVPLAAERTGAVLQVFVAGTVPRPGESPDRPGP